MPRPQRQEIAREVACAQARVQDSRVSDPVAVVRRDRGVPPRQFERVRRILVESSQGLGIQVAADRKPADAPEIGRDLAMDVLKRIGKVLLDESRPGQGQGHAVYVGAAAIQQIGHVLPDRPLDGKAR